MIDDVHIRWLIRRDYAEVLRIEADACPEEPWGEEDLVNALRERRIIGMVAEQSRGDLIYGYMVYELHPKSLGILKLAVAPEFQRQGVGRAMISQLVRKLEPRHGIAPRRSAITCTVAESNLAAQLFLRVQGFRATGIVTGAYGDEDGYTMRYRAMAEVPVMETIKDRE